MKNLAGNYIRFHIHLSWLGDKNYQIKYLRYFVPPGNDQPGNVGGLNGYFDFEFENSTSTEMDCGRLWVVIFYYQN